MSSCDARIVSVVGARPQFVKAAPVSRALAANGFRETFIHTGQHYDQQLSGVFFDELDISQPDVNLNVGSGPHGWQTGHMLIELEQVFMDAEPDWVLVYGDTNSTLAAALAAAKLQIPLAHVEAGLRSHNRSMPEEHNRVLTDHLSDLLLCPTQTAMDNLAKEGIFQGVHLVGDVMYDAMIHNAVIAESRSRVMQRLGLTPKQYLLVTIHRPGNTDALHRLRAIMKALETIAADEQVVLPAHPRTRSALRRLDYAPPKSLLITEPVGYFDMLMLEQNARVIATDSGGVQKEAYLFAVPCLTLREETEWEETVETGWNRLVGANETAIVEGAHSDGPTGRPPAVFGDGRASERICSLLNDLHHRPAGPPDSRRPLAVIGASAPAQQGGAGFHSRSTHSPHEP